MIIDPISDMLVSIRNGLKARLVQVAVPASNIKAEIAKVMKSAGYIQDFFTTSDFPKKLVLTLKYSDRAEPAIRGLQRQPRPGLRKFVSCAEIPAVLNGMGLAVLSTSKGVMSGVDAKKQRLGGELICTVW